MEKWGDVANIDSTMTQPSAHIPAPFVKVELLTKKENDLCLRPKILFIEADRPESFPVLDVDT